MGQNTRSQAYTISSATPPREYSDFEARILVRAADTSPRTNQEGATGNGANRANAMMMTYKTPAILALRRGDLSTVPFAIFGSLRGIVNSTLRDELTCCSQPSCSRPRRPYSSRDNGRFLLKIYTNRPRGFVSAAFDLKGKSRFIADETSAGRRAVRSCAAQATLQLPLRR